VFALLTLIIWCSMRALSLFSLSMRDAAIQTWRWRIRKKEIALNQEYLVIKTVYSRIWPATKIEKMWPWRMYN
jgi:hypothetical protein